MREGSHPAGGSPSCVSCLPQVPHGYETRNPNPGSPQQAPLEPVASFVRPGQSACFGCLRLPIPIPGDEISHAVAALKARLAIPGLGFIVLDGAAGASRERAAWRALRPAVAESFAREEERGEGVEWYSLTVP